MKKVSKVVEEMLQEELLGNKILESFEISKIQFGMIGEDHTVISPADVSKALKGIKHALVGGYAIPVHTGKPRATMDVDMVVDDIKKAEDAIEKAFPELKKGENPGEDVTRFYDESGSEVINLLHPVGHFGVALGHTISAKVGNVSIPVNSFEGLFCNKFLSMNSPHRSEEGKIRDKMDLMSLVNSKPDVKGSIDWKKIETILKKHPLDPAEFDYYQMEMRKFVDDLRAKNKQRMQAIKETIAQGKRIQSF
jgi:hypothetical protein